MSDKTKFNFNKKINLGKRNLAEEVIKKYLLDNLNKTYQELKEIFHFSASNKHAVIYNQEDYNLWLSRQKSKISRYFDPIIYGKEKIYICNQWSIASIQPLLALAQNTFHYNIEILNDELKILDKLINALKNKENEIFTREEIIHFVIEKYPSTNRTSIIPSDYCYNKKNKGSSQDELFEYIEISKYKYLGKNMKREDLKANTVKNIILYGAPGVGKTHNYQRIISMIENGDDEKIIFNTVTDNQSSKKVELNNEEFQKIKEEKRVEFVTFHQSYSYEDFIEGFRPNEDGKIKLEDGILKNIALDSLKQKDKNFYIVIDEINRGNISKIFGELITLIEEDKRDTYEVTLPYSKKPFKIPSNLYIIATMNSTDKSIATIDIALRRRFTFLKMKPNLKLVQNDDARVLMKKLNAYIESTLGEDYMLGHSYFMGEDIDLDFIKEYKIKPLLEEYFYAENITPDEIIKKALEEK